MKPIIQLNQSLVNKIAAGEVVERPLSVVKELTENAIDAGASTITVEIQDGGLTLIRVTDNGSGIEADSLPLAFARHATSKIASFDDLMQVQTLGFRGEALSSISAVAQVEMITKTPSAIMGTRVEVHGGKLVSSRDIGCVNGTTVIVANLFYSTPARRKFLKKPATEAGYISHCMERLALGNPRLSLRYINNGQIMFQTNGNGDLRTTLLNIYGREVATKVAAVDGSLEDMSLKGFIGKPEIARGNRQHGSLFINGRYIQSQLLTKAIESAMKTMLPSGKFPIYALSLFLPAEKLDVNVHPTKMDVRFSEEDRVFAFVEDVVRDTLEEHNLIPAVRLRTLKTPEIESETEQIPLPFLMQSNPTPASPPTYQYRTADTSKMVNHSLHSELSLQEQPLQHLSPSQTIPTYVPPLEKLQPSSFEMHIVEPEPEPPKRFFTNYQIHGLVFTTYWMVEQNESLYMIDQHAAHERILFEEFLRKAQEEDIHAQTLISPIPLYLTTQERQILQENKDIFARFGFEISNDIEKPEILAVPFLMKGPVQSGFFSDLLDKMGEVGFSIDSPYTHKTELIAMAACKAAVKAGDKLDEAEAHALIKLLLELENPFTCPHGRPTIIEITKKEVERRFKRS
ncbi:MAG: DNA mismatch repair endonuclease MutL [Defluviitaleaceae bacterium]|nr:DNA mismatch repair endonuclease MutL [Defluviitaleaceae bacterium]